MRPPLSRALWLVALWIAPLSAGALTIDAPWTTSDATASLVLSQAEIDSTRFTDAFAGADFGVVMFGDPLGASGVDLPGLPNALALDSQGPSPSADGN